MDIGEINKQIRKGLEGDMDKSDVELMLDRNEEGEIVKISYKINDRGEDNKTAREFQEIIHNIFLPSQDTYNLYIYDSPLEE